MELNINNYKNFLDYNLLTSEQLLSMIEVIPLEFLNIRNQQVEWNMQFPMFIKPFYDFVYRHKEIPTQEGYFDFYIQKNSDFFDNANLNDVLIAGLRARVYRTYPSLVRDLHFNVFLKEKLLQSTIFYNTQLDIENDIDTLIIKDGLFHSLSMFTDTVAGREAREKKRYRSKKFSNVTYLELPVDFKGSFECGKFFLYGEREFKSVIASLG